MSPPEPLPRWAYASALLGVIMLAGAIATTYDWSNDDPDVVTVTGVDIDIPEGAVDLRGQTEVTLDIADNVFDPRIVVVSPGTVVSWTNLGRNKHNVMPSVDDAFEAIATDDLDPAETAIRTFDSAGGYPYYCSIHGTPNRGQRGQLVVG